MADEQNDAPAGDQGDPDAPEQAAPDAEPEHIGADDAPRDHPGFDEDGNELPEPPRAAGDSDPVFKVKDDGTTYEDVAEAVGLGRARVKEIIDVNETPGYVAGIGASLNKGDTVRLPKQYTYVDVDGVSGAKVES